MTSVLPLVSMVAGGAAVFLVVVLVFVWGAVLVRRSMVVGFADLRAEQAELQRKAREASATQPEASSTGRTWTL